MAEAREYPRPFGRYVLLRLLGAGGMGEVYAAIARQTLGLERLCAIKTIRPDLAREKEFRRRFRDEARISVSMAHPNVIGVHEVGCIHDTYFIAMELVEGYDLGRVLSRARRHNRTLSLPAALFIAREVLAALDYSHSHTDAYGTPLRLVHRDISPSNVMVSFDGRVRLADFGLASSSINAAVRTSASRVWGRPGYVAPERLLGRTPDRRVDIYAVGVLLYELLTGEPLVRANEPATALREAQRRANVQASTVRREIPREIDLLVQHAVAFDPADRYDSAAAFQDATQACLARLDPIYHARHLGSELMARLFDATSWHKPLRAALELAGGVPDDGDQSHVETFAGTNVLDSHTAGELGMTIGAAGVIDSPEISLHAVETQVFSVPQQLSTPQLRRLDHDDDEQQGARAAAADRIAVETFDVLYARARRDEHDEALVFPAKGSLARDTPDAPPAESPDTHHGADTSTPDATIVDDFAAHLTPPASAIDDTAFEAEARADADTIAESSSAATGADGEATHTKTDSAGQLAFDALLSDGPSN